MKRVVIAIDGPLASGKSTLAKALAQRLNYRYFSTGIVYRMLALEARRRRVELHDEEFLARIAEKLGGELRFKHGGFDVIYQGENITPILYSNEISKASSIVSRYPAVREALLRLQREMAQGEGLVVDGRDVGTVVFPEADVKFYITASEEERVKRRKRDLERSGEEVSYETVARETRERDARDSSREAAPLLKSPDAVEIDSTHLTIEEALERMLQVVRDSLNPSKS